jgi:hypothetical protein
VGHHLHFTELLAPIPTQAEQVVASKQFALGSGSTVCEVSQFTGSPSAKVWQPFCIHSNRFLSIPSEHLFKRLHHLHSNPVVALNSEHSWQVDAPMQFGRGFKVIAVLLPTGY